MRQLLERRLSFGQLRAIEAIDRYGNLSQAAIALGKTQPAVSKSLQEAEDILNLKLFERRARGVVRCACADAPVLAARRVLASLRRLEDELDRGRAGHLATVAVGATSSTALGLLPSLLRALMQHDARVQVRLVEDDEEHLLTYLGAGGIDMMIGGVAGAGSDQRLASEPLYVERLAVIARAGHPLFGDGPAPPPDAFDLLLSSASEQPNAELKASIEELGLRPSRMIASSSIGFLREVLHSTDMVAIVPALAVAADLRRGTLRIVAEPDARAPRACGIVRPSGKGADLGCDLLAGLVRTEIASLIADGVVQAIDPPGAA